MSTDIYSLTLVNLALDGSLDLFIDLYNFTYEAYFNRISEEPELLSKKEELYKLMVPEILPQFELLAFRRLPIFTRKIKKIHLKETHFRRLTFFSPERIREFNWKKEFYKEWKGFDLYFDSYKKRYADGTDWEFELQKTFCDLQHFVNNFKHIVTRAIQEELQKGGSEYKIADARRDVRTRIAERMKMRRSECVIQNSSGISVTKAPLFVFDALNKTKCKRSQHRVTPRKYYANHLDDKKIVALPVHYCETCGRYMIGAQSLSILRTYLGKMIFRTINLYPDDGYTWNCLKESELHKLGYNVVEGKLSFAERRTILISILDGKQLSFFEVVATIEQNIRTFESNHRMQNAVRKWREDLRFINEYMVAKCEEETNQ